MSRDLLLEIGVEEVPSAPLYDAVEQVRALAAARLEAARLPYEELQTFGSPRRIALVVRGLAERQSDLALTVKGPAAKVAFDENGQPTKAAEGFARSRGLAVTDLVRESIDGAEYVVAHIEEEGRPAAEVLPGLLTSVITDIEWVKSMRWGSGSTRFIRPVRWLVALFGDEVVPVRFAGLEATQTSAGHRFLAGPVEVSSAGSYADDLAGAYVMVSAEDRARVIREGLDAASAALNGTAVVPGKTFKEVVNLVEWPSVVVGTFDDEFLEVPREIVEEAMESHQRYFPVDDAEGRLMARFLVVHNGDPARAAQIVAGHERVIRARLADAVFFFREDLKRPLEAYVDDLDVIVFHEKLGSLGAKVRRIERLSGALAIATGADASTAASAARIARLAKADLVTQAVVEFTSLQGVMGRHYALAAGESAEVADGIPDHYRPRFAGDALPATLAARIVAIADKLDTIAGIFAIGQAPTGSADPYALRRQAIGILAMLLDGGVRIDLDAAIAEAVAGYRDVIADLDAQATAATVREFFDTRLAVILKDQGYAHDEILAVLAVASGDVYDTARRVAAVKAFRATEGGADLAIAFKRAANLSDAAAGTDLDAALLTDAERALEAAIEARGAPALGGPGGTDPDYSAALEEIARLRAPVDEFFEKVLVMDPDPAVRRNRLALLNRLVGLFDRFADFSKLAG